jgi:hypothetical protein
MSEETETKQTDHNTSVHDRAADHDSGRSESLREGLCAAWKERTGREPEDSRRDEEQALGRAAWTRCARHRGRRRVTDVVADIPASTVLKPWERGGPTPNPKGRGKGVPNKFSQQLVADFARHWRDHGYSAIERVYDENPGLYLKIATSLVPRELLLQVSRPMEQMSDAELQQAALEEQEVSQKLIAHIRLRGGAELIEAAARELTGEDEDSEA